MADNVNAPFGLSPARYRSGAPYNGAVNMYYMTDATASYIGSLVKPDGSCDAVGIPTVTANVSSRDKMSGVMVSVVPQTNSSTIYRVASVNTYVLVADDPTLVFRVQEDSLGGAMAATNMWNAADLITITGSATTGLSNTLLDSSTATTGTAKDFLIVGFENTPSNVLGNNYAVWLVLINNWIFTAGSTGA